MLPTKQTKSQTILTKNKSNKEGVPGEAGKVTRNEFKVELEG